MSVNGHPYWPLKYQIDINNHCYPVPKQYPTHPSNGYHYQNTQDTDDHRTKAHEQGNIELPTNSRNGWKISNDYDRVHDDEHETLTELEELGSLVKKY
jgi:hypothetical protein